ncbi:MAG: restriction endonuclease subunit S [Lachnospiraceae bacterium]|nr:restriction endonuclease subunit S [Lachnospiraceae bacterium]
MVEVPYLRVANVQGDHVDFSDIATIFVTPEEAEKYRLRAGQMLMTEGGDRDKLGRGCKWNGEIENCIHQNHVFAVQTDDDLLTDYLDYLTTSDVARTYFDVTAKKTTNLACTNKTTIQRFTIPVPTVDEQREICAFLDDKCAKLNSLISQKEQLLTELENYKKSLIYEYVTGKKEVSS